MLVVKRFSVKLHHIIIVELFCLQVTQNVTFCHPTRGSFLRHVNSVMKTARRTKNSTEPLNNSIAKLTADFAPSQSLPTA